MLVEVEEIELLAEAAMVALSCLLEAFEVGVQLLLAKERGPVDPRELGVRAVPAPVRARERGELDCLDRRARLQVRSPAQVGERTLRVQRDPAFRRAHELDLVGLLLRLEPLDGGIGRHLLARPGPSLREQAPDLRLDRDEVVVADRLDELEVVVEAVVDRRADRDLHVRVQAHHRLGEQMGARVAEDVQRVRVGGVPRREDLDARAVGEGEAEVLRHAVRTDEHRLLREPRSDRAGGIEPTGAVRELERGSVGKEDVHAPRIVTPQRLPRSRLFDRRSGDDADGVPVRCPHRRMREGLCVQGRPDRGGGCA